MIMVSYPQSLSLTSSRLTKKRQSGLLSATVAGFLSTSYLGSQTSSQDVSAFYLAQIYQLQANVGNSSFPSPPKPVSPPTATHAFWFASLVLSLASAVFANLVQEWVRRYMLLTQTRFSPHRRARIRAYLTQEGSLDRLQRMIESLNTFLHLSIFMFLLGLITLTSGGDPVVILSVCLYIAIPLAMYLWYSLMPFSHPHTIYSTPLTWLLIWLRVLPRMGLSLLRAITCRDSFSKVFQNGDAMPNDRSWLTFDSTALEVEKAAETHSSTLDAGAISWLFSSLGQDQEFEQFLAGIPDFYRSKRVEDPTQALRTLSTDRLPRAIVSFMDRSLTSDLVSGITERRRIKVALKAIGTDAHLLQRTFYHALCVIDSAVFQCVEFVHLADGWTNDGDADVCFLAKCVVAVAISRIGDNGIDDRWSDIVQRRLKWSQYQFSEHRGQGDSVKLRNLVQLARELNSAHPDYDDPMARTIFHNTLSAARRLRIENASVQLRREFCEQWNRLVGSMQDIRRDPVVRSNAMRILCLTRELYIHLHEGTESRCFAFAGPSAGDDVDARLSLSSSPQKPTAFPLCTISTHRLSHPDAAPEYSEVVASGYRNA